MRPSHRPSKTKTIPTRIITMLPNPLLLCSIELDRNSTTGAKIGKLCNRMRFATEGKSNSREKIMSSNYIAWQIKLGSVRNPSSLGSMLVFQCSASFRTWILYICTCSVIVYMRCSRRQSRSRINHYPIHRCALQFIILPLAVLILTMKYNIMLTSYNS